MAAVFVVGAVMAMIWSAAKYLIVYRALVDSLPPQLPSRYTFPVYALSASTPLPLQAEYVKSLWGGSVGFFCVSLCFFSLLGTRRWLCRIWRGLLERRLFGQGPEDLHGKLPKGVGGGSIGRAKATGAGCMSRSPVSR